MGWENSHILTTNAKMHSLKLCPGCLQGIFKLLMLRGGLFSLCAQFLALERLGVALGICLYLKDIFLQPVYPASQRVDVSSDVGGLTFGVKPT